MVAVGRLRPGAATTTLPVGSASRSPTRCVDPTAPRAWAAGVMIMGEPVTRHSCGSAAASRRVGATWGITLYDYVLTHNPAPPPG